MASIIEEEQEQGSTVWHCCVQVLSDFGETHAYTVCLPRTFKNNCYVFKLLLASRRWPTVFALISKLPFIIYEMQ